MQMSLYYGISSIPKCSFMPSTLPQNPLLLRLQTPRFESNINTKKALLFPLSCSLRAQTTIGADNSSFGLVKESHENDKYEIASLQKDCMPKHVAVILDGNRRWFKMRGLNLDYDPFLKSNMLVVDLCLKWGIGTTTCFIYALENMRRSKETNDLIFKQFDKFLLDNLENFNRKGMKVSVIGESSMYPNSLKDTIKQVEEATSGFANLELMFAVCYGGTRDVVYATRNICRNVKAGLVKVEYVNEALIEQNLYTKNSRTPNVDLLIRTGGHLRLSNYLLWQLAEAELYFTDVDTMAPNFGEDIFIDALQSFQLRERTFGK